PRPQQDSPLLRSSLLVNREVIAFGPTKETFTETNLKEAYGNQLFFNGGDL
ncbi:hypothetical protein PNI0360_01776, partial [Streptococcus pneumoniae PNI0360]